METARSRQRETPGAATAFLRYTLCGGGVGLAAGFAVTALASWIPWALANALVALVSTLLSTELHARFTFGGGGRATRRQHTQSAGSAVAAYAVTCAAMLALEHLVAEPGEALRQLVYLAASALAGLARFAVLRLVVFARTRGRTAPAFPVTVALPTAALPLTRHRAPIRPQLLVP
ncbi:GtrA domain-containing protein [Streptomyces sp. MSC1_001]|jgi:putative flippase GtrA